MSPSLSLLCADARHVSPALGNVLKRCNESYIFWQIAAFFGTKGKRTLFRCVHVGNAQSLAGHSTYPVYMYIYIYTHTHTHTHIFTVYMLPSQPVGSMNAVGVDIAPFSAMSDEEEVLLLPGLPLVNRPGENPEPDLWTFEVETPVGGGDSPPVMIDYVHPGAYVCWWWW